MKCLNYLYVTISIVLLNSCSTQTAEVLAPTPEPAVVKKAKPRNTTCTTLDDLDKATKSTTEDAFTLYRDQIRFKNFEEAKPLWDAAYFTAPGANGRATYHFDDGIKIYHHFFTKASTTIQKQSLADTVLSIYDMRMKCFDDNGTILARKAFDSYYNYRDYVDSDETFSMFKEVIDRKGEKADYFMVNPFSRMLYDRVLDKKISNEEASKYAYKVFDIIAYGKANCKDAYCEAWDVIENYSPELLSGLEGIRGFYQCQYYMDKYYAQFEENPTDCDNVTEVYLKMVWANCDKTDPKFIALKAAKEKECYVAPPPPGPLQIARDCLNNGDFDCAIDQYNIYLATEEDAEKKAKYLFFVSKIYYAHKRNFPAARKYARLALEQKENWGEPYMLIGKLYASSGPLCGPGTGWDSQIVTWPAIDKFQQAKRVDPSMAAEANKWINKYSQYMPDKEDVFQRQLKQGGSFKVGCWIQESTTIRSPK